MEGYRLEKRLGWLSVGLGLVELTFAKGICRLFSLRGRAGLVRVLGARDLITGVGLLAKAEWLPEWRSWGQARAGRPTGLDTMESNGGPMESWRGSGLAEDVGASGQGAGAQQDESERQQRMEDARQQLGLPDPESVGTQH